VLSDFVGRTDALATLDGALARAGADGSRQMAVFSIVGAGGIGKTSLALWWAHGNLEAFPDGQLYVDLQGFGPADTPMSASVAVRGFLAALGVPDASIPADTDDQTALYRSLLSGRRTLVLLDNARDVHQVLPLLPGSPTCTVLVTSRTQLAGLQVRGAHLIALDTLPDDEARALLVARVGKVAAATESESVTALVRFCAGLPLGLAIVAARATEQRLPLASLVEELAAETSRLDALDAGDVASSTRAVLSWSYRALPPQAARAFRLLSLVTGPDVGLDPCAALLDTDRAGARVLLRALAGAHLVQEYQPNRFRMHDLLRIFARECLHADELPAAQQAAVSRLLGWFLRTANAASQVITPLRRHTLIPTEVGESPFQTYDQALNWLSVEHRNVTAAIDLGAERGAHDLVWPLAIPLSSYYNLNKGWREYLRTLRVALEAARMADTDHGMAWVLNAMGITHVHLDELDEAMSCFEQALALRQKAGDQVGASVALNNLGETYRLAGDYARAVEYYERDHALCRERGDEDGQSICLNNLGKAQLALGNIAEAVRCQRLALELRRRVTNLPYEAEILTDLGDLYRRCRQLSRSHRSYQLALSAYRELGDALGAAQALVSLGELAHERGNIREARRWGRDALSLAATLNEDDARSLFRAIDALLRQLHYADDRTCAAPTEKK
jgi:tetratricopeptide (TPR) repeat protein